MRRKRLLWKLYPSYLVIAFISLFAVSLYASWSLKQFYLRQLAGGLEERARLLEQQVVGQLASNETGAINTLCKELGGRVSNRITVILPSGLVVGDSEKNPARMDNHADRPEIVEALSGRTGTSIRFSNTLKKDMMYVAIPMLKDGEVMAVLRTSLPLISIKNALGAVYGRIAFGAMMVIFLAAAISLAVSRYISRPLEEMIHGSERFARGELGHKLPIQGPEELSRLAIALNEMAEQLDDRIRMIVGQRNEREAILSSMVEGVLAVDAEERLIIMNQAAEEMLGVAAEDSRGRSIQEVTRNVDLHRFIRAAFTSREPVESDIVFHNGSERFLQVHGNVLRDAGGHGIGAVIVLNDVTRIRRLENIRRDFVANVSHELKTPVTSIKGFVETLLDGAMEKKETLERFLRIMKKQADHLNAIIEDLLSLSRIEKEAEKGEIVLERGRIKDVLESAIQVCEMKGDARKVSIQLICPDDIYVKMNAMLLEQAVMNLVDNAIKYSEPGNTVRVKAIKSDKEVAIQVRDQGCGIAREHLSRLFERFYIVDRGRNNRLGGTGLGLAIVKHIAQSHGGRVAVESTVGEGSMFTIYLQQA